MTSVKKGKNRKSSKNSKQAEEKYISDAEVEKRLQDVEEGMRSLNRSLDKVIDYVNTRIIRPIASPEPPPYLY